MSPSQGCTIDAEGCETTGIPLYWSGGCTSYSVADDGSKLHGISYDEVQALANKAVAQWMAAKCPGGGNPDLNAQSTGPAECRDSGFNLDSGNVNLTVLRDDDWFYSSDGETLALTTTTYDTRDGHLLDADIEINSQFAELTTGDDGVVDDLESILTHEFGHFFGLAHVNDDAPTMSTSHKPGDTHKRSLDIDDIDGICATYPPKPTGSASDACDAEPRNGFDEDCLPDEEDPSDDPNEDSSSSGGAGDSGGAGNPGNPGDPDANPDPAAPEATNDDGGCAISGAPRRIGTGSAAIALLAGLAAYARRRRTIAKPALKHFDAR